jgi:hypothetical protein
LSTFFFLTTCWVRWWRTEWWVRQALEGGEEVGSSQVARAFLLFKLASDPSSRADVAGSLADELCTAIVNALYRQVRPALGPPLMMCMICPSSCPRVSCVCACVRACVRAVCCVCCVCAVCCVVCIVCVCVCGAE